MTSRNALICGNSGKLSSSWDLDGQRIANVARQMSCMLRVRSYAQFPNRSKHCVYKYLDQYSVSDVGRSGRRPRPCLLALSQIGFLLLHQAPTEPLVHGKLPRLYKHWLRLHKIGLIIILLDLHLITYQYFLPNDPSIRFLKHEGEIGKEHTPSSHPGLAFQFSTHLMWPKSSGSTKTSKKVHSGSATTASNAGWKALRHSSKSFGSIQMSTWRESCSNAMTAAEGCSGAPSAIVQGQ